MRDGATNRRLVRGRGPTHRLIRLGAFALFGCYTAGVLVALLELSNSPTDCLGWRRTGLVSGSPNQSPVLHKPLHGRPNGSSMSVQRDADPLLGRPAESLGTWWRTDPINGSP